jgi:hypothetical protein
MAGHFFKIHVCSEIVTNANYVDIDYSTSGLIHLPNIVATTDTNVNTFITAVTLTSARINFSTNYTGTVKYSVISV